MYLLCKVYLIIFNLYYNIVDYMLRGVVMGITSSHLPTSGFASYKIWSVSLTV